MAQTHQPTLAELRMRIAEKRLRQFRIAAKLDISDSHLANILAERKPVSPEYLQLIAEAIEDVARGTAA